MSLKTVIDSLIASEIFVVNLIFFSSSFGSPGKILASIFSSINIANLPGCAIESYLPLNSLNFNWNSVTLVIASLYPESGFPHNLNNCISSLIKLQLFPIFSAVSILSPVNIHILIFAKRRSRIVSGTFSCNLSSTIVAPIIYRLFSTFS